MVHAYIVFICSGIVICRCDQYRWVTKGVYTIKCFGQEIKKRSNAVDSEILSQKEGDDRFRRWEYWGYKCYFLLHYTGDHTVYKAFPHRSLKQAPKPFIRSAPFVKEKVGKLSSHCSIHKHCVGTAQQYFKACSPSIPGYC